MTDGCELLSKQSMQAGLIADVTENLIMAAPSFRPLSKSGQRKKKLGKRHETWWQQLNALPLAREQCVSALIVILDAGSPGRMKATLYKLTRSLAVTFLRVLPRFFFISRNFFLSADSKRKLIGGHFHISDANFLPFSCSGVGRASLSGPFQYSLRRPWVLEPLSGHLFNPLGSLSSDEKRHFPSYN